MMKNLDKIRGEDERENNQSSEYKIGRAHV